MTKFLIDLFYKYSTTGLGWFEYQPMSSMETMFILTYLAMGSLLAAPLAHALSAFEGGRWRNMRSSHWDDDYRINSKIATWMILGYSILNALIVLLVAWVGFNIGSIVGFGIVFGLYLLVVLVSLIMQAEDETITGIFSLLFWFKVKIAWMSKWNTVKARWKRAYAESKSFG